MSFGKTTLRRWLPAAALVLGLVLFSRIEKTFLDTV